MLISGCDFQLQTNTSILLDSVLNCRIVGCHDISTPTNGSWSTVGTHAGKGSYSFDNNQWHTTAPSSLDTGSKYSPGDDTGIKLRNAGNDKIGSAGTSLTINHGLATTPDSVRITPALTVGDFFIDTIGATSFKANWVTSADPDIHWSAEVNR